MTHMRNPATLDDLDARDFEANPLNNIEVLWLFRDEDSYLGLAKEEVILDAADLIDSLGDPDGAAAMYARWQDYQEELRCMMAQFM